MKKINNILDFKNRTQFIDNILNTFTFYFHNNVKLGDNIELISNNYIKFFYLCLFHYGLLITIDLIILFSSNFYLLFISIIIIIIQIYLNIIDNGCFLMKLERKYIGKHWIGPYKVFDIIFGENTMNNNKHIVIHIFKTFSLTLLFVGLIKLFYL